MAVLFAQGSGGEFDEFRLFGWSHLGNGLVEFRPLLSCHDDKSTTRNLTGSIRSQAAPSFRLRTGLELFAGPYVGEDEIVPSVGEDAVASDLLGIRPER